MKRKNGQLYMERAILNQVNYFCVGIAGENILDPSRETNRSESKPRGLSTRATREHALDSKPLVTY